MDLPTARPPRASGPEPSTITSALTRASTCLFPRIASGPALAPSIDLKDGNASARPPTSCRLCLRA